MNRSFAALRSFARPPAPAVALEHCELCSVALAPAHRHLLEMKTRKVWCACDSCALRFDGLLGGRFKVIPRDPRSLPLFEMTDAEWEDLSLPIGMAFFFHSTPAGRMMALYPSPAGATESLLPLTAWEALVEKNPPLAALEPDVEALLVNRVSEARDYFIAPIDACFELVGTIRIHWRGLSGGDDVWREIASYFARLSERAAPAREVARA